MQQQGKKEYCENGFYVAKNLVPTQFVDAALSDIHKLFSLQLKKRGVEPKGVLLNDAKALFDIDAKSYLAAAQAGARLRSVQSLLMHEKITEVLAGWGFEAMTMPTGPMLLIMSNSLKFKDGYFGLEAHQDWTSTQGSLDMVTVWMPLVDVGKNLFPLEVVPKSHLRGVWPGKRNGLYYEVDQSSYKDADFVQLETGRGDVVFMSGFTLHRTGIGEGEGIRPACSTRYDNAAEKNFVERNYPTPYSRALKQEFTTELPSVEEVRKVFR